MIKSPAQTYLALGDSYTRCESVLPDENFPYQVVKLLINDGIDFQPPQIVAQTSWTTDELEKEIQKAEQNELLHAPYNFVSLLIGVNNQYRGRNVGEYEGEFERLLKKAISLAGNKPENVVVLSIPDWGVTPYATGRDQPRIAREIDEYNAANRKIAARFGVHYIDITPGTREAALDETLLAADGLHPSSKEFGRWAKKVAAFFKSRQDVTFT